MNTYTEVIGEENTHHVAVSISEATDGVSGNAYGGKYAITCVPDIINIGKPGKGKVIYTLVPEQQDQYDFTAAVASDYMFQLSDPILSEDKKSIAYIHNNQRLCLISVCLMVKPTEGDHTILIDPQMTNRPDN